MTYVDFSKPVGLFGAATSFLSLFQLYFNGRMYKYGDKVNCSIRLTNAL